MNTPCPVCNHLQQQMRLAFIRWEYAELKRYTDEYEAHKATCEIINECLYLGLWQNAQVAEPLAHWIGDNNELV